MAGLGAQRGELAGGGLVGRLPDGLHRKASADGRVDARVEPIQSSSHQKSGGDYFGDCG